MINKVIEAVSIALDAEFGNGYEIHMESVEQGLEEPCFFIQCLEATVELFLGNRYLSMNQLCIHYFPASEEVQRECNETAERMSRCLEHIIVNDVPCRGTKMNYHETEGVLQFFVNYDMFIIRAGNEVPDMEEFLEEISAKG